MEQAETGMNVAVRTAVATTDDETLAEAIRRETGDNVFRCYQCVKCTSGCPLAERFDLAPSQVIRALQLDDPQVLESKAIWLCASCHVCTTRCPMEIDVAAVMKALCREAKRRGVPAAIPDVDRFNAVFLLVQKLFGRVHELTLAALYNLVRGRLFDDWKMGLWMLRRRRLRLIPRFVRPPKRVAPVTAPGGQVAYFPGCSADSHASEYDRTARATTAALDIELVVPPRWTCCGASAAPAAAPGLANLLPMRTVASVEQMGLDTVTSPCSACFVRLRAGEQKAARNPDLARELEARTGHAYRGSVKVQHLLDVVLERAGLEKVRSRVRQPLRTLQAVIPSVCQPIAPAARFLSLFRVKMTAPCP